MGKSARRKARQQQPTPLKLDLGCGPRPKDGFHGVDIVQFGGKVSTIHDLRTPWPWPDGSVEAVHSSHFIEHLTGMERVHFANELYRILVPKGTAQIVTPHWSSCRAYGDPTHQWPPMTEFWFYYLDRAWRLDQAPHTDGPGMFQCDFGVTWGYTMHQSLVSRNQEYQQTAIQFYKDAVMDIVATFTKK